MLADNPLTETHPVAKPIPAPLRAGAAACALALAAACSDAGSPVTPPLPPAAPAELAALSCRADVRHATVKCAGAGGVAGANGLIIGGQHTFVEVTAANAAYDGEVFRFDVSIGNLIPQPMGTTDGTTPSGTGVRIFFHQGPTVITGTGSISVANPTDVGTFTGVDQPYFEYSGAELGADGILSTSETSSSKGWELAVDATVTTFDFILLVSADVPFPNGWIDVTPAADSILEGGTQPLSATVRTRTGQAVPGATVTWGTSDAGVATVDAAGTVTAVAPGAATITATAGARSGSATLQVCPDLAVGEAYTAVMPGAAALCFAGAAGASAEYTYMPVNLSSSSALSLSVTGSGIAGVTGPPTPNLRPGGGLVFSESRALQAGDDLHARRMERERRELTPLLSRPGTRVDRSRARGPRYLVTPGVPSVGDLWSLNVASGCSGTLDLRTGRVVSIGQHVVVVADTTNPPGGFTTAQYDSIAAEFDSLAYPVDTANFGGPTDLDDNDRVVAFYTRAVNELSPPASSVVVQGFFTARDLFSSAPASCPMSNEGEMFYMLVPDPTGVVNSNVRTVSSVRGGTVATMAHELQHLINASRRVYVNIAPGFEEVWLNEGLSHIAEELIFYRTSVGLAPRGNIVLSTLTTGPSASRRVAAFNTYANQNYGRLRSFLQRPDTAGAVKNTDALAVRGAIWAFLRYSADRVNGSDAAFWFSLVNSTTAGKANLQAVLGTDPDPWVRDWIAAMYADDAVAGVSPQYQTTSWSYRSVYGGLGGYPLGTRPLTNGVALTLSYSRGGGTAYVRFSVPADAFASVTALSGGLPPSSPYALIVMRTK